MNSETKICQNCKQEFVIDGDDFGFYEKIKVPAPTWCAECRLVRRLAWRNEKNFYNRECVLCKNKMISIYSIESKINVYCSKCWWSDK